MKDKIAKKENPPKKKPVIFIIIIALVCAVTVFGAVLGIVSAVRNTRAVIRYENIRIDEGVSNYLVSTFKYNFISDLIYYGGVPDALDSPEFWETEIVGRDGVTYGELLTEQTEKYLRSIAVGAHLFDRYSSLSKTDRERIEKATAEILDYKAKGNEDEFNRQAAESGFDYDDFCTATELIYKAKAAKAAIYGENGQVLTLAGYTGQCEEYLATYSHVKLVFIRTETDYKKNDNGEYEEYSLSAAERAERLSLIENIEDLIENCDTDSDTQMSPVMFTNYAKEYFFNPDYAEGGYYLSASSSYSQGFEEEYPGLVSTAIGMTEGAYGKVRLDGGVCFIYKYAVEMGAYLYSANTDFFDDFYADAAVYLYDRTLSQLSDGVTVKDSFYNTDVTSLPYNKDFIARVS